jgi:hypothetical protein
MKPKSKILAILTIATSRLPSSGYAFDFASPTGGTARTSRSIAVTACKKLSDMSANAYASLLVLGGPGAESLASDASLQKLARSFNQAKKPVAASGSAVPAIAHCLSGKGYKKGEPAPGIPLTVNASSTRFGVSHKGKTRTGALRVPARHDPNTPSSLVFSLHGEGGQGEDFSPYGFDELADDLDMIMVYPDRYRGEWDLETGKDTELDDRGFFADAEAPYTATWMPSELGIYRVSARAKAHEVQPSLDGLAWRTAKKIDDGSDRVDFGTLDAENARFVRIKFPASATSRRHSIWDVLIHGLST